MLAYQPLSEGDDSLQKNGLVYGAIELEVSGPASHAKLGGACRYRIVPMAGLAETLPPMLYGPAISNTMPVRTTGRCRPYSTVVTEPQHRQRHKRAQLRELWERASLAPRHATRGPGRPFRLDRHALLR